MGLRLDDATAASALCVTPRSGDLVRKDDASVRATEARFRIWEEFDECEELDLDARRSCPGDEGADTRRCRLRGVDGRGSEEPVREDVCEEEEWEFVENTGGWRDSRSVSEPDW